jgi:hypothetical protein
VSEKIILPGRLLHTLSRAWVVDFEPVAASPEGARPGAILGPPTEALEDGVVLAETLGEVEALYGPTEDELAFVRVSTLNRDGSRSSFF